MDIKYNEEKDWRQVRETVFIKEQHFQDEFDDIDMTATHLTAYEGACLIGCGRIYPAEDLISYHIGRVAVFKEYRNRHFGARLLAELEYAANKQGAMCVRLDAQLQAIPFYEKQGYVICGEEHMDEHVPHIEMMKII